MYRENKGLLNLLTLGCFSSFLFIVLSGCATGQIDAKAVEYTEVQEQTAKAQDLQGKEGANQAEKPVEKPVEKYVDFKINKEPQIRSQARPQIKYDGSLWRESGLLSDLFINPKARRIGDIVTIKIVESSTASNKASTQTGRSSSISGGIDSLFGIEKEFEDASHFNPFASIKSDLTSSFNGSGTTTRSGDLTAYITTRVTGVLPNGNLMITGSREVTVNNERQYISISGIIRPRDISPQNIILSTYISDARIAYSGKGVINDRQRPGWLARVIDTIWPF